MTYEELSKKYNSLREEATKEMDKCAREGLPWEQCVEKLKDKSVELHDIGLQMRLLQQPTITYGKNYRGTLVPIDDFVEKSKNGVYRDSDGYGMYATETSISDIKIYPSDTEVRKDFSHVVWFRVEKE